MATLELVRTRSVKAKVKEQKKHEEIFSDEKINKTYESIEIGFLQFFFFLKGKKLYKQPGERRNGREQKSCNIIPSVFNGHRHFVDALAQNSIYVESTSTMWTQQHHIGPFI